MSNITPLHCKPDTPGEISMPGNLRLFRMWNRLRGERPMPDKQELDLRAIASELPWLGIAARDGGGRFVWRLAGSGLCDLWNRELRGEETFADWPSFERDTLKRMMTRCVEDYLPAVARLNLKSRQSASGLPSELIALPMRDAEAGGTIVLIAIMPPARIHNPAFYDVHDVELTFMRVIWPHKPEARPAPAVISSGRETHHGPFRVITGGRA